MATTSYSNLFGTNGAGQQTTSNLFGQQAAAPKRQYQPPQNFAQMQQQGIARPAPPQAKPFQQYGGSQQAQQARSAMLGQLQQQLAQPTRFDTEAFKQIRGAQQAQLGQEYRGMQQELEERLARQGLSASTFGSGRFGDLAGQQSRALASLDAQLLQQAAQTQAQDRLAAMQAGQGFAELAGAQDLQQFEANRVGQATEFEQGLRAAEFGQRQFEQAGQMGLSQAQLGEQARQFDIQQQLAQTMGLGQLGIQQQGINVDLARLAETSAERQLREQLGLSEIAGVVYARNAAGNLVPATDEQKKQVQTLAARQMAQQQAQFTSQLSETTAARLAQTTQAQQELAFRQQLAQAEVTGNMDIPMLDATGKPTGQMQRVSSLAANRLGMEGTQLALQQASQLSQQTGFAYTVGDDGKPTQLIDPVTKAPIRTESSAARLTQQELQQAELRGYIEQPDPTNPSKTVKVDTLSAKNLNQQQLNFLAEQASQRSQQSGFVFGVTDGKVAQVLDANGQPIRTESAAARLSQQELQRAEIRGYFEEPSPSDPTKKVPVSTVAAKQLTQQQVRDAVAQADMMSRQSGYQFKIEIDAQGNPTVEPMYAKKADGTDDFTRQLTTEAARAQQAQEAQATAERNLRERLGLSEISGIIYETKNGVLTPSADQTMARRQLTQGRADALTQATGILHMVDEKGEVVPRTGTDGKPITTANIQQMDMDRRLRQMLGMTEATGVVFDAEGRPITSGGQPLLTQPSLQAQQSLMVQLAGIMSGATAVPPQYNDLLKRLMQAFGAPTTTTTTTTTSDQSGGGSGGWGGAGGQFDIIPPSDFQLQ